MKHGKTTATAGVAAWVAGLGLAAAVAPAGFTTVVPNTRGEPNIPDILNESFNADVVADGVDYVDGDLRFRRLDDDAEDLFWPAGDYEAFAEAKFTGKDVSFGYAVMEAGAASFRKLFDVEGDGYDVSGAGLLPGDGNTVVFAQTVGGDVHTSVPTLNPDVDGGRDHLVTYAVEDSNPLTAPATRQFMLFWEDLTDDGTLSKGRTKDDFNDLAVLLSFSETGGPSAAPTAAVPLPAGAWAGIGLLGTLAFLRKWRG